MIVGATMVSLGVLVFALALIISVWLGIGVLSVCLIIWFYQSERVQVVEDPLRLVVMAKREILLEAHYHRQAQLKESKEEVLFF